MRTAEQIYSRIRWDPGLDEARFRIGYEARLAAPVEIDFVDFVPGGDVPWHRILYFTADGEVVWDRPRRIDRLGESERGRVTAPRLLREPLFTARAPHAFADDRWSPVAAASPTYAAVPSALRVLTWNVLFDRYDKERIDTARRRPLLMRELERADADVIALQEVEPPLLKMLLAEEWVRERYVASDAPSGRTVEPYGVILLSRLPVLELAVHELDPHKKIVAMVVALADRPLVIATVHLTSDHAKSGAEKREKQLAVLREALACDASAIALGDFNDSGDLPERALELRDAWTEVHGDDAPTYDPPNNPLAAIVSRSGRPLRLDRVLVRGAGVRAASIARLGTQPLDESGLLPSDHYGLAADLEVGAVRALDAPSTHRTALAWIPPDEAQAPIQAIRRVHDPRFDRWMPHVNVLYGFVPEHRFEEAAELVAEAARPLSPFPVALESVRAFPHREGKTLWLDPAADAPAQKAWGALARALLLRFPRCDERHRAGFTPHLSLGRFDDPSATLTFERVETSASELALISRRGDEPMAIRALVSLGRGEVRFLDPLGDVALLREAPERTARAQRITARLAEEAHVELAGSRRLGCAIAASDLDLVWIEGGDGDAEAFARRVEEALAGEAVSDLRLVQGARVDGVKLRAGGLGVDITYVPTGDIAPREAVARRAELDPARAAALSAISDADAIRAAVAGREAGFLALARVVKAWAHAKGLDEAAFGTLPSLAWMVLAARVAIDAGEDVEPSELLARFFATWAAWDPREPIALDPAALDPAREQSQDRRSSHGTPSGAVPGDSTPGMGSASGSVPRSSASRAREARAQLTQCQDDGAPLRIATPTAPIRNCAATADASALSLLQAALYDAWEIAGGPDPLPRLFAAPPLARQHASFAVVTLTARDADDLERSRGWVRGRALALLRAIGDRASDARFWPRPFQIAETQLAWAIGLGRGSLGEGELAAIAAPWIEEHLAWPGRPSGARLAITRADGGEIPTLR